MTTSADQTWPRAWTEAVIAVKINLPDMTESCICLDEAENILNALSKAGALRSGEDGPKEDRRKILSPSACVREYKGCAWPNCSCQRVEFVEPAAEPPQQGPMADRLIAANIIGAGEVTSD